MDDTERAKAALRAQTPAALRQLDLQTLVGQSMDDARQTVKNAGGIFEAVGVEGHSAFDHRPNRVTVVIESRRVVRVLGIG